MCEQTDSLLLRRSIGRNVLHDICLVYGEVIVAADDTVAENEAERSVHR